ncbi:hypothetical protein Poly30_45070 [Planctomycetes bacterium Poly30]|uniref:Uncharacterized protein n=1 Tax=Saltatorellus ferox TaxID=2528018 RepID=A0A518EXZ5_9BACT|nr:hypothetical protein Poly30_45070 [Planctomycetes bacterium Poly30]
MQYDSKSATFARGRTVMRCLTLGLLSLCGAACSSDDDSNGGGDPPQEATFNTFVLQQFSDTADDTEPVSINDTTFTFNEDPNAFDSLLMD